MASISAISALSLTTIAFLVASTVSFNGVNGNFLTETYQREFDYFVLALQWPGTNCRYTHKCCHNNGCCRRSGVPTHFTIHGLWPNYNDGGWPSCCSRSAFDINEISTLRHALDEYWPSLSCGSPSTCHGHRGSFWAHEVEMHGTCATSVMKDEYQYFLTVLNIYFKYNVTEVLSKAGYVPSNSERYPLGGVITAIGNAFHQTPLVVCSGSAVKELRLCFYKNFKPRDCATGTRVNEQVDSLKYSCPKYVSFPTYDSSGLKYVEALESITI
ncbi:Ribonuclease 2 [Bienertia sinuspersici]